MNLSQLNQARKHLALGRSLKAAANLIGVSPSELDLALWKKAGEKPHWLKKPARHF